MSPLLAIGMPGRDNGLKCKVMKKCMIFLAAAPLDFWKAGVGVVIWIAGMTAVLAWCMVTLCRHLDE